MLGALSVASSCGSCWVALSTASALPASFGSEGADAGQIEEPRGIAIEQESGDVYIADRDNNRIDKFDGEGNFLLAWGWGVADGKSEGLQTCTSKCFKGLKGFGAGEFNGVEGIAADNGPLSLSHGDVYVADTGNQRVQKFGPEGEFKTMFGGEVNANTSGDICPASEAASCKQGVEGAGPGQFTRLTGRSVAIDPTSATVSVGDEDRVQRFSEEGAAESEIALPGTELIENLALDSAKDIYLHGSGLAGVHKYDPTGAELGTPRDEGGFGTGLAIAVGPADQLFLNDFTGVHHILTFTAEGEQTASFDRGELAQNGQRGFAYSEHIKALYILNSVTVRIVTPPPPGPFILLGSESVSEIEPTTATLHATINPEGPEASSYHFEYGTSTAYGQSTPETPVSGEPFEDQSASAALTSLAPGTTYHFRAVAENAAKEVTLGPDIEFTTLPVVSIDHTSASEVDATSARLEAQLNPHGVKSEYRFEYGTSTAYGTSVPIPDGDTGAGTTDTTVSNLIQELTPSTTYHYRVIAHNELNEPGEVVIGPDHTFTTQGPASVLPDGRTWELVSPPNKHGSPLEPITEEGGLIQAAPGGGAFAYVALGPVNEEPKGVRSPEDSQLLARRGATGWRTQDITTPHEEVSRVNPGIPSEYRFFAEDLSAGIVEPVGATLLDTENPANTERTPYRREADGSFAALVSSANVPAGVKFGGVEELAGSGQWVEGVEFRTASPDLAHIVLSSPQALTADFGPGFEATGRKNIYELTGGALTLISRLPESGEPATEAGLSASGALRGGISGDGNRVVFGTAGVGGTHLYVRDVALAQTLELGQPQPGAAGGEGTPEFQTADNDVSRILFTDIAQLTPDATAKSNKPDLYMCEVEVKAGQLACNLSDLSVDLNPGEAADVQGEVSAIDASATHVYFAANGVLTSTPNARGEVAVPGECKSAGGAICNLYEYDTSAQKVSLVAVLSSDDDPDWVGHTSIKGLGGLTTRSSPDGRYFTFMSQRSLTGYDNRDARSGMSDAEVFLLDAESGKLSCVSCNRSGARPHGVFDPSRLSFPGLLVDHARSWQERWLAGSVPGWTLQQTQFALYQSRYLANNGRLFFNASDALVPQDKNNANDVYQFEPPEVGDCATSSRTFSAASGGCVNLISSGSTEEESAFLDASESGDEVFFLTVARLRSEDVDDALDVYDAHVCSSSSPCPPSPTTPPTPCEGDSCQNPNSPPGESTPASLTSKGPGNPPPLSPGKAKAKPPTRAQLLAKALRRCRQKKNKHKRVSCERQARKRYRAKQAGKKKAKGNRAGHAAKGRGQG